MRTWAILCLCSLARVVYASSEVIGLQERAQGQSLVGSHQLSDSLYSNPAGSAFTNTYAIEGAYLGPRSFGVSVIDTKTSSVSGGLGYFRAGVPNTDEVTQGVKLALGTRVSDRFALGLAGKAIWGKGPAGDSRSVKDIDVGFLVSFDALQLGGMVRNVFGGDALVLDQDREASFGARVNYDQILFLSVATQAKWTNFKPYQVGIGFEYVTPYSFSVKAGYRFQPSASLSFWSAGASVSASKFGLHYAIEFPAQGNTTPLHALSVSMVL